MKRSVGIILIVAALLIGFLGMNKLNDLEKNDNKVDVLGVEISVEDKDKAKWRDDKVKETAYILFGIGALALIAGAVMIGRKV